MTMMDFPLSLPGLLLTNENMFQERALQISGTAWTLTMFGEGEPSTTVLPKAEHLWFTVKVEEQTTLDHTLKVKIIASTSLINGKHIQS